MQVRNNDEKRKYEKKEEVPIKNTSSLALRCVRNSNLFL